MCENYKEHTWRMTCCSMFFTKTADIDRSSCKVLCSSECVRTCSMAVNMSQLLAVIFYVFMWFMFSPALGSFVTTAVWLTAPWTSHALHQGLRSPEPLLGGLTAVHSGQTRECIAFISRQVYRRKKHLDVWNYNSHDAFDIRGCTHHFIHLSQSVPPILPVSKNFLSKVNNG